MNTKVNLEAAIGVLSFLATAFVFGLALIIILHSLKKGKRPRVRKIGTAALGGLRLNLAVMRTFSFISREKALAFGEEKHYGRFPRLIRVSPETRVNR